jgi:hypothetical protein
MTHKGDFSMKKVRVTFPNGSDVIVSESIARDMFGDSNVKVTSIPRADYLPARKLRDHNNTFSALVGAIDAKWGHTYEAATKEEEQPNMTDNMKAYMGRVSADESYNHL